MQNFLRRGLPATLALFLFYSQGASALPVSTSINLGKPLVFVDLNSDTRDSLGALGSLGTDVSIFVPDYPFALGVYYEAFVKTDYGSIPINNAGLKFSYYPFGKPVTVQNQSGEVNVKNLGMSIYGSMGTGLTFMNIRDPEGVFVFGAAAFNLRLSTTLEYPLSEIFSAGATLMYQTSFGGSSPSFPNPTVGITGWTLMASGIFTLN